MWPVLAILPSPLCSWLKGVPPGTLPKKKCDFPSHQLKQLLANDDPTDSEHITAVTQLWCEIFDNEETWLTTSVCVCVSHVLPSSGLLSKVKVCPLWSPLLWTQRLAWLSDRNGGWFCRVVQESPYWHIKRSLVCDILSWSRPLPMDGNMVDMSPLKPGIFFFLAGCNRSLGYRQSRLKRRKDTRSAKT